uniref:Uncharacterized protein n=1 Tax=viral metagenome TaxID=1070528 RepID=A0A6C0CRY6_9ZZZZ
MYIEQFKGIRMGGVSLNSENPLRTSILYGLLIGIVMGLFFNKKQNNVDIIMTVVKYSIIFGIFIYILLIFTRKIILQIKS